MKIRSPSLTKTDQDRPRSVKPFLQASFEVPKRLCQTCFRPHPSPNLSSYTAQRAHMAGPETATFYLIKGLLLVHAETP